MVEFGTVATPPGTLSHRKRAVPVVVVPGIMGSRLWSRREQKVVWDPDGQIDQLFSAGRAIGGMLSMTERLTPANFNGDLSGEDRKLGHKIPGFYGISNDFYGPLLKALHNHLPRKLQRPVAVYAFGYDWRQSNRVSARRLAQRFNQVAAHHDEKMIVIAHSMGGLVSRYHSKFGGANQIRAMFLVGSPTLGAPEVYMTLRGEARAVEHILFRLLAPDMPSAYELLPLPRLDLWKEGDDKTRPWLELTKRYTGYEENHQHHWVQHPDKMFPRTTTRKGTKYVYRDPYTGVGGSAVMQSQDYARRMKLLSGAEKFHKALSQRRDIRGKTYVHPHTYVIYNDRLRTIDRCKLWLENEGSLATQGPRARILEGDGSNGGDTSVPTRSARPPSRHLYTELKGTKGLKNRFKHHRVGGEHSKLLASENCINVLLRLTTKVVKEAR